MNYFTNGAPYAISPLSPYVYTHCLLLGLANLFTKQYLTSFPGVGDWPVGQHKDGLFLDLAINLPLAISQYRITSKGGFI